MNAKTGHLDEKKKTSMAMFTNLMLTAAFFYGCSLSGLSFSSKSTFVPETETDEASQNPNGQPAVYFQMFWVFASVLLMVLMIHLGSRMNKVKVNKGTHGLGTETEPIPTFAVPGDSMVNKPLPDKEKKMCVNTDNNCAHSLSENLINGPCQKSDSDTIDRLCQIISKPTVQNVCDESLSDPKIREGHSDSSNTETNKDAKDHHEPISPSVFMKECWDKETMTCQLQTVDVGVNTNHTACRLVKTSYTSTTGPFMKKLRRAQRLHREACIKAARELNIKVLELRARTDRYKEKLQKLTEAIEKKDKLLGFTLSNRKLSQQEARGMYNDVKASSSKLDNQKKQNRKLEDDIHGKTSTMASTQGCTKQQFF